MKRRAKTNGERIKAVAYLRTSSAANVGGDKDSDRRQREAIEAFARRAGFEIVGEYYDAAVSGADPITSRPGFAAMLERIAGNAVRTIIVETANRFARDLMVQEVGYAHLRESGIELIAADGPQSFVDDTPTARLVRGGAGLVRAALEDRLGRPPGGPPAPGDKSPALRPGSTSSAWPAMVESY
jgi:DNA invertase Pin-like site-specific DNA recombinase